MRKLTKNEIKLCETMFGDSINYDEIEMHNRKANFLQPDNFNAAPDGNLYMIKDYCEDYSEASTEAQASFLHEMTHVWQIQNNTRNLKMELVTEVLKAHEKAKNLREEFHYAITSRYTLDKGKDLNDYSFEQQAGIVEDFTLVSNGKPPVFNEARSVPEVKEYKEALTKLLDNPNYATRPKNSGFFS